MREHEMDIERAAPDDAVTHDDEFPTSGLDSSSPEGIIGDADRWEKHNLPTDKMQMWRLMSLCRGPQCLSFDDTIGQVIDVKHYYMHRVKIRSKETGKVNVATRCVLIDQAGTAYAFASDGIRDAVEMILTIFGNGPWGGEVKIKVVQCKTASGRRMYTIEPQG